jgi:hypothetical protein
MQSLAIVGAALTMQEGREAVQRRARPKGLLLSDLDADSVSEALGNDPLLIAGFSRLAYNFCLREC